jgi:hypothetical protein
MGNGNPPNKWDTIKISPVIDPAALSSAELLEYLNHYPINAATTAKCSDGTFLFVGYYAPKL